MNRIALAFATLVLLAATAFAGPGTDAVKHANDQISSLLKAKADPAKVTTSVRDFLDIDELGKRAMVDQWSKITAPQQTEFLSTLRSLIEANYVSGMKSNLAYTVDYTGESADADGNVTVTTQINTTRHNRPYKIEVDYVLKPDGGKLKAWDVKTDGVGLVENYRTMFNNIMSKGGFSDLIDRMKKKLAPAPATATTP